MKPSQLLSCCLSLWLMISYSVDVSTAQSTNPYQGYQPQSQPPLQNPAPASTPVSSGESPPPARATDSGAPKSPGEQEDPDLLDTFDKYLLNNLEQLYYLLSYAFKDASTKTLDKCGCTTRKGPQATSP